MSVYERIIEIIKDYSEDEAKRRINSFFKYESIEKQLDQVENGD